MILTIWGITLSPGWSWGITKSDLAYCQGPWRGPLVDIAQSPQCGPQKKKSYLLKKSVVLEGFEPPSLAWKSSA
jgi:hypothetical protein